MIKEVATTTANKVALAEVIIKYFLLSLANISSLFFKFSGSSLIKSLTSSILSLTPLNYKLVSIINQNEVTAVVNKASEIIIVAIIFFILNKIPIIT